MHPQFNTTCQTCGKPLHIKPSRFKQGGGKYCSRSCNRSDPKKKIPFQIRFWKRVQKSEDPDTCWEWLGARDRHGYGLFEDPQGIHHTTGTHRIAWMLTMGLIPTGLSVLHNCPLGDNPLCVNPRHLFLGTQLDNLSDMRKKGRGSKPPLNPQRGTLSHNAVLNDDLVRAMRQWHQLGVKGRGYQGTAEHFGINWWTAKAAIMGRTWAHID